ncbi:hypothetical protein RRG08_038592 [Elysia crispata]|uniref:Uncharacterized protein n=1 Tax=Elysia crispata TaxID=231223 RepID=A0AAE1ASD6_9GAST|nr:hypothetical protein RRG08_038592 [Elysia crispata]
MVLVSISEASSLGPPLLTEILKLRKIRTTRKVSSRSECKRKSGSDQDLPPQETRCYTSSGKCLQLVTRPDEINGKALRRAVRS